MGTGAHSVEWVSVKSRMLLAVAYNRDWQFLYLKFRSGDVYCYRGVPSAEYRGLLSADSKGKYVRDHILNRYPYQRVHAAVPSANSEDQVARKADERLARARRNRQPA